MKTNIIPMNTNLTLVKAFFSVIETIKPLPAKRAAQSFASRKAVLAGLAAAALLLPPAAARATIVLNDFQGTDFQYTYGSFTGNVTTNPTHISINATESGGGGEGGLSLDLSSYAAAGTVRVEARLIAGNLADNFNVLLMTDGSNYNGYQFSTASLSNSTFTLLSMNLNSPTFTTGTINWSNITEWQLQGDFSSTDAFRLEFRNLRVVPEPSVLSLSALGLLALANLRRRRGLRMS